MKPPLSVFPEAKLKLGVVAGPKLNPDVLFVVDASPEAAVCPSWNMGILAAGSEGSSEALLNVNGFTSVGFGAGAILDVPNDGGFVLPSPLFTEVVGEVKEFCVEEPNLNIGFEGSVCADGSRGAATAAGFAPKLNTAEVVTVGALFTVELGLLGKRFLLTSPFVVAGFKVKVGTGFSVLASVSLAARTGVVGAPPNLNVGAAGVSFCSRAGSGSFRFSKGLLVVAGVATLGLCTSDTVSVLFGLSGIEAGIPNENFSAALVAAVFPPKIDGTCVPVLDVGFAAVGGIPNVKVVAEIGRAHV